MRTVDGKTGRGASDSVGVGGGIVGLAVVVLAIVCALLLVVSTSSPSSPCAVDELSQCPSAPQPHCSVAFDDGQSC